MKQRRRTWWLVALAVALSACGGGFGAVAPSPSPSQSPTPACSPSPTQPPSPTPSPSPSPSPSPPAHLIKIVLSAQHLTAYEGSKVVVSTDVATGRPGMETPTGHYRILAKYSPFRFTSMWPRGDPRYFDPLWSQWAMLFEKSGYFIHDAWWQVNWGPGANLKTGSHGCVNVPAAKMGPLYAWARVGDAVVVVS